MDRAQKIQLALVQMGNEVERLMTYHQPLIEAQGGTVTAGTSNAPWANVDKTKLPAACFLWVEDPKRKSTWHLPYREGAGGIDPNTGMYRRAGLINLSALRAVAAALGGARTGKPMSVPAAVRSKIERLLKRYKIGQYAEHEEREMRGQLFVEQAMDGRLSEASLDKENCIVKNVAVLNETSRNCSYRGGKGRRFALQARQAVANLIEGVKAYRNHQRKDEREAMGGVRRAEDLIGKWSNGRVTESGQVRADLHYLRVPAVKDWVEAVVEQMPEVVGSSINAVGSSVYNETDRMEDVTMIEALDSVDIVTQPGSTRNLFESRTEGGQGGPGEDSEGDDDVSIESVTLAQLREQRPDLLEAIIQEQEAMNDTESTIKGLREQLAKAETEKKEIKEKLDELELKQKVAEREAAIEQAISESKLDRAYISETFRAALSAAKDDETVKALLEDRKKMVEATRSGVRGMGDDATGEAGGDETPPDEVAKKEYLEAAGITVDG